MVHSVEQPNFIDSLATTTGYSYLLDMFGSPLLPPQEEHHHQQPSQMNSEEDKHPGKCYALVSQMSNGALEKTPNQIGGHDKSFGSDVIMLTYSGSTQAPNDLKITAAVTTTTKVIRPKKKGLPWTKLEHELFLEGMERYGRGDWKSIAQTYVLTRTPAQVASHAQKYFARLKRTEKTGVVHHPKAGVPKDTRSLAKPVDVHLTIDVHPSGNGNVSATSSNPASAFSKLPQTFTNPQSEESDNSNSTLSFLSGDSAIVNRPNLFPPWKFPGVNPTIYVPPLYVSPSNEDVCISSMDFITSPTSENTIAPPTISMPQSENVGPYPDLNINSSDKSPTISAPPSNNMPVDLNVYIPSIKNLCSDSITEPPILPISPLDSSFADHDVYKPLLDFLDAPPSNNVVVHPTIYVPPLNTKAFDPTIPMPPNDLVSGHPAVSLPQPKYRTTGYQDTVPGDCEGSVFQALGSVSLSSRASTTQRFQPVGALNKTKDHGGDRPWTEDKWKAGPSSDSAQDGGIKWTQIKEPGPSLI